MNEKKLSLSVIISFAIGVVVIGTVIGLRLGGVLYFGFKERGQHVIAQSSVCNEDIVTYNQLWSAGEASKIEAQLQDLSQKIQQRKGVEGDPTCQQILFNNAYTKNDVVAMKRAYQLVSDLHSKGRFVDNSLINSIPLGTMKQIVEGSNNTTIVSGGDRG